MKHSLRYRFMLVNLAIGGCMLASTLVATSLSHLEDLPLQASWPRMRVPKWSHGALLTVQDENTTHPQIWVLERTRQHAVPFTLPGAQNLVIYDWDRGADGTIGISGSAADADGRVAAFAAWIFADGARSQIVRTVHYRPAMVAVAPDGTLWTVGSEFAIGSNGKPTLALVPNVGVLRHFDATGKLSGSFIPQSTVQNPISLLRSRNTLRVSKDRVAWYSAEQRYVELSFDGTLVTDISLPLPAGQTVMDANTGFALTDDGEVFLSTAYGQPPKQVIGVYALDRVARAWNPVLQPSLGSTDQPTVGYIYGVDGRQLVLQGPKLVRFYSIGQ